ncbi:MAG: hypothetical protein V7K40_25695 [Nostoc sp.]|uniref:hypothetical protein n=1 Tax=Nostoc sp. TaxID=1180 RepID=UPI002FFB9D83
MTANMSVLTDSKTLNEVVNCLTENISIKSQGKCEQKNIFKILIRAATQRDSLENTTKVLKNANKTKRETFGEAGYPFLKLLCN